MDKSRLIKPQTIHFLKDFALCIQVVHLKSSMLTFKFMFSMTRGLIYNKTGLKVAYVTFHAKVVIYKKTNLAGECAQP